MEIFQKPEQPFTSPEEEVAFLKEQLKKYENPVLKEEEKNQLVGDRLKEYAKLPSEEVLHEDSQVSGEASDEIVLDLAPEEHDKIMEELLGHLMQSGVLNTLNIVDKMNNPHITDDFHRLLVEYIRKGYLPEKEVNISEPVKRSGYNLFQIAVSINKDENEGKKLKELIGGMEQFYAGISSVTKNSKDDYIVMEIANPHKSSEFIFYIAVPAKMTDLLEKQITSIFPHAGITLQSNDYNIFASDGFSTGSYATLKKQSIYPLKSYDQFEQDPMSVILNVFTKIKEEGEGASIQLIFKPGASAYTSAWNGAISDLRKGKSKGEALSYKISTFGKIAQGFLKGAGEIAKGDKKSDDSQKKDSPIDSSLIEVLEEKVSTPTIETNLRLVVSAENEIRSEQILHELESAFNQFEHPHGNTFEFKRISSKFMNNFLKEFSFRLFSKSQMMPLSIREVTSLVHFPTDASSVSGHLKQARSGTAPAPANMPTSGTRLGINKHRGSEKEIFITPEDRLRHLYVIGQTGTGKTTLLRNMIIQDIKDGNGICFIDPHGSDVESILAHIPKERAEDVIYFDPSYTKAPMGLNMLQYDERFPEQKTFVVNEMLSIFNKLFDMKTAGGPMFEQYFRNATMLVIEDPSSGNTLLEISRVLADKKFREMKLMRCKNPIVLQFWTKIAEKAGGESSLENIVPYITSKFDVFLSNEIMRPIVAQEKSSINFREIMDNKKILLVNLAKGRLGDINSSLLGLIIVGKILMSALSRVDSFGKDLPPFYLYIDEFQNVTTDSISTILSEARKYKLGLTIAHQFIAQLEDDIRDSVFGNVGSMVAYRVGSEDAEFLEKQFKPTFTAKDIMNIENLNAYVKMLANGEPQTPFSINVPFPDSGMPQIVEPIKELSHAKYGTPRAEIEREIMKKYV